MADIFGSLIRDWDGAEHAISDWFHPHHSASQAPAAQPVTLRTTAPTEEPMGYVTDVKNELAVAAHDLASHAVSFDQNVLPGLAAKLAALENNPVIDAVLNAAHVPPEALGIVVATIDGLEALYNPAQAAQAPVPAQ